LIIAYDRLLLAIAKSRRLVEKLAFYSSFGGNMNVCAKRLIYELLFYSVKLLF
jgi:hypothetical protein